jgi:hypothetical protein
MERSGSEKCYEYDESNVINPETACSGKILEKIKKDQRKDESLNQYYQPEGGQKADMPDEQSVKYGSVDGNFQLETRPYIGTAIRKNVREVIIKSHVTKNDPTE